MSLLLTKRILPDCEHILDQKGEEGENICITVDSLCRKLRRAGRLAWGLRGDEGGGRTLTRASFRCPLWKTSEEKTWWKSRDVSETAFWGGGVKKGEFLWGASR